MSDLRFALRTHLRAPAFTLAAALVLALGIGATTAIFTLVQSLLLEPLPYPQSDRLVWIWNTNSRPGIGFIELLGADFEEIRDRSHSFEKLVCFFRSSWNLTGAGDPQRLSGARVSEGFFETLGVRPVLGRSFLPGEHQSGREMVAVFSDGLWRQRFAGDPSVIGRRVTLDGASFEVVGVMPPDFPLGVEQDMWAPMPRDSIYARGRDYRVLRVFGRLKKGVRLETAQSEASVLASDLGQRFALDRGYSFRLVTFDDQEVGGVRQTLWIFAAAVGGVLLIACSNVASLLLARALVRARELAVRAAIGASRAVLIRQLLVESSLLALAGGVVGYPLGIAGVRLLIALDPSALPRSQEIHADWRVTAFAFLLSLVTGLIFGIVPALRSSSVNLRDALKEGGRGGTAGRRGNRLRSALVVLEVALGVVLMAGAGLLARSFRALTEVRRGYDTRNVLTMNMGLTSVRYRDPKEAQRFIENLIAQLERYPGVEAAGATNNLPLSSEKNTAGVWLDTQPEHDMASRSITDFRVVTPGYFRAMGVPLQAGRFFEWTDRADTPNVLIVNDAFVRQLLPQGQTLGKRITVNGATPFTSEIVGVVGSFHERSLNENPIPEIFAVLAQTPISFQTLVVRSIGEPAGMLVAVRSLIVALDRDVPIYNVRTMQEQVDRSLAQPRLRGALLTVFSVLALVLASLGIYGVIACAVAERRQEMGIRLALGARPNELRRMVVFQGLKLTLMGLALGLAGAIATTRLLAGFLFGVSPADPLTYISTAGVFLAVAVTASYLPARRATRSDPLAVLREE